MALQVSSDAQLVFFSKVFGLHSPTTERVKGLIGVGVTFEVSLYNVRAFLGGKGLSLATLTIGSSALMKGTVDPLIAAQNKHVIEEWVAKLYQSQGAPQPKPKPEVLFPQVLTKVILKGTLDPTQPHLLVLIKAVHKQTGGLLADAKTLVQTATSGVPAVVGMYQTVEAAKVVAGLLAAAGGDVELVSVPVGTVPPTHTPVAPKPVAAVIHLKDAKALGQKVHGTSTGSVYHCVALSEHVKVAARIVPGGSISIRAEWTDNPTAELKKLEEAGVGMKGGYGSIHFDPLEVPVQRVIGAFLVGTGISWKAMVTNGADLVIGGK